MPLLERLGLKRKPAAPTEPAPRMDGEAMVIVAGITEVEQRRRAAGLNPTERMATTRNAAESQAMAGQHDEARTQLGDFRTLVDDLLREQGRWGALAGQVTSLDAQIAQMAGWGDARAAGLGQDAKAAKDAAAAQDFAGASATLTALASKVPGQHRQAVQLREHTVAMVALGKRTAVAEGVSGRGMPNHARKPLWDAYDAAKLACPAVETDPAKVAGLPAAREALSKATEALIDDYKRRGSPDWHQQAFKSLESNSSALLQKAGYVRPASEEQFTLKEAFDAAKLDRTSWATLTTSLELRIAAAKALLASTASVGKEERQFFRRYPAVNERVEAARKTEAGTEELRKAKAKFDQVNNDFQTLYFKDPPDYAGCLARMDELGAKADAVLKPRLDAAKARIGTVTALPTDGDASVVQQQKDAKSLAAQTAIMDDTVLDPLTLKSLPPDEKIALLEALSLVPLVGSSRANAEDPKRVAQRKVYAAMDLDPAFVTAEKKQRKAIVAELEKDKEELRTARDNWTALAPAERRAVLVKMMNAQCAALKCAPPTDVVIVSLPGNDNGHYDPGANVIRINPDMPVYNDFELASDLIFHENSHNYQAQLVARLSLPDGDANKLTKANTDPPYTQARMFAVNDGGNGYVVPDEDYAGYTKQPMEDHSWTAGPDTSRRLQRALA